MEQSNTNSEQDVIADYHEQTLRVHIEGQKARIKRARNALFIAAAIIFIAEMIAMFRFFETIEPVTMTIAVIEAGIFVALAFWTRRKPYTAIITGLIYFILLIIVSAWIQSINSGSTGILKAIFGGIIFKVIILVNLITPIPDAKDLERTMKENPNLLSVDGNK